MKKIFIEWSKYGSRSDSLAHAVGAIPFFIGEKNSHKNLFYSFLTYFPKSYRNFIVIRKTKPDVVFIANTNWVIAFVNLIFSFLFNHKLVFDSHSCTFDHAFLKYPLPLSKYFAKRAHLSIAHNEFHYKLLTSIGANAIIVIDIPFEDSLVTTEKIKLSEKVNLCFICNYSEDEPFFAVFEAANKLDNVSIYITGDYNRVNIKPKDHPKINFTGFLPIENYKTLINSCDILMTLTTRENTMQAAGSEAISVGKPLITSNTKMLREYFKYGTIFVDNTCTGIVEGINNSINALDSLKIGISKLKNERREEFAAKLETINNLLKLK